MRDYPDLLRRYNQLPRRKRDFRFATTSGWGIEKHNQALIYRPTSLIIAKKSDQKDMLMDSENCGNTLSVLDLFFVGGYNVSR